MRPIDADALIDIFEDRLEKIRNRYGDYSGEAGVCAGALHLIRVQPTVDAVEVVRCKDCKYKYNDENQIICQKLYWCDGNNFEPSANDFCSMGERREDE